MAGRTFTASLEQFRDLTTRNMRYVARQAIQDVLEAAQTPQPGIGAGASGFVEGKIPVVTSELINSLTVDGASGRNAYVATIAGMEIGDFIRFAWTAPYAMRIEAGFTGTDSKGRSYAQPGRFFVLANAQRFSEFVGKRVKEVRR